MYFNLVSTKNYLVQKSNVLQNLYNLTNANNMSELGPYFVQSFLTCEQNEKRIYLDGKKCRQKFDFEIDEEFVDVNLTHNNNSIAADKYRLIFDYSGITAVFCDEIPYDPKWIKRLIYPYLRLVSCFLTQKISCFPL